METVEAYSMWLLLIFATVLTFTVCTGLLIGIGYFVISAIDDYKERKTTQLMVHKITQGKLPPPPKKL